ncbi:MAG: hypothetical protein OXG53_10085 [Chloroflexi bacterium]|nr:hypothetical protein [Chloroflexota bacterium]
MSDWHLAGAAYTRLAHGRFAIRDSSSAAANRKGRACAEKQASNLHVQRKHFEERG